jgi:hypothetical protein
MSDLPPIRALPDVTPAQAWTVIRGLKPYDTYLSSDLYRRYLMTLKDEDRDPVHPTVLGRMLKRIGCRRVKKGTGSKARSAWRIVPGAQDERWGSGEWT